MENTNYRFSVEALTADAEKKLERIARIMDDIEGTNRKGASNFFTSSQKDIDNNIRAMREYVSLVNEVEKEMKNAQSSMSRSGNNEGVQKLIRDQQRLREEAEKTRKTFQDTTQNKTGSNAYLKDLLRDQKAYNDEIDEGTRRLKELKDLQRDVARTDSRLAARTRQATSSGNMNSQQAGTARSDLANKTAYMSQLQANQQRRDELRKGLESDQAKKRNLNANFKGNDQERQNELSALNHNIETRRKEIEALKELDSQINKTVSNMESYSNQLNNVNVKPDRNSWQGVAYERAPSIAMAALGGAGAIFGGLYAKGSSIKDQIRPDTISIGQRTGNYDFRSIRKQNEEVGMDRSLGYNAVDMIDFQNTYLSSAGFKDQKDLDAGTRQMAEGSRAIPVDKDSLNQFMGGLMTNGAVSGADQVKAVQQGFIGAVKASGMEGREKDQLKALEAMSTQTFAGRNGSNAELNNLLAIQSLFSSSGDRSMQGTAGAEALSSLDAGMKQSAYNPQARLLFGMGSEYQGVGGMYQVQGQMEKGLGDTDNLNRLLKFSAGAGRGKEEQKGYFKNMAENVFGTTLTNDQVDAMYKQVGSDGTIDKDKMKNIQSIIDGGKDGYDKNKKGYEDSKEATENASKAVTDKQATAMNDMGDIVRKLNSVLGGMPAPLYGLAAAAVAAAGALAMSGGMSILSGGIKGKLGKKFGGGIGKAGSSTVASAGAGAGASSTASKVFTNKTWGAEAEGATKASSGLSWGSKAMEGGISATKGLGGAGKLAQYGKGALKGLGPLGLLIGGGASIANIASAENKTEAIGEEAGGWGGAMGGAAGGAAIGAMFGGVGAIPGALIGGVLGGIGGSKVGKWAGGKIKSGWDSLWGGDKIDAAEINGTGGAKKAQTEKKTNMNGASMANSGVGTMLGNTVMPGVGGIIGGAIGGSGILEQLSKLTGIGRNSQEETSSGKQDEKDTVGKKATAEKERQSNTREEAANLSFYSKLLDRAEALLMQARNQNGLFGKEGLGTTATGSGGGDALNSGLNFLTDGKKWTNKDLTKHDLGSTIQGITADELDEWINSKAPEGSAMRGMGSTFLKAAQESGLDPRYLVAHAATETGWGTSNILKEKGNWFGIGAYDNSPMASAYKYGDKETGVVEGAKWIAENYYNKGQTTLESMRHNGGQHEYATDPNWDKTIASIMGGSEKYVQGKGASLTTSANITVNMNGDSSKDKKTAGKAVGDAVAKSYKEQSEFFSKQYKRT
ncbi:tail associated lysin [Listeria phage A511]|uniref:Gp97 n=1 Tax=Listeria phage A511 TaxID=2908169 RepID=A8AST1_BPA51|nr:tail associated lysin [Listeria phage A511]AAY52878.1 gp97 [Listeria phage A511]